MQLEISPVSIAPQKIVELDGANGDIFANVDVDPTARDKPKARIRHISNTFSFAQGKRFQGSSAWSFGVMGDTQWFSSEDPEGVNPEYVAAGIGGALQQQFIDKGVSFVVQTGDLSDRAGDGAMAARAEAAQTLYNAGIGFFPLRGNHETYGYLYGRDSE